MGAAFFDSMRVSYFALLQSALLYAWSPNLSDSFLLILHASQPLWWLLCYDPTTELTDDLLDLRYEGKALPLTNILDATYRPYHNYSRTTLNHHDYAQGLHGLDRKCLPSCSIVFPTQESACHENMECIR